MSRYKTVYKEVDVEVDMSDFDTDELIEELKSRGLDYNTRDVDADDGGQAVAAALEEAGQGPGQRQQATATMAVRSHEWQHPFGVVKTRGMDIIGFEEKPVHRTHVNAGIYVIEPTALDALEPGQHCDMPTLFERLQASAGRTIVYPMHEPWLDVGRPSDLERAREAHIA
jgi:hypothetical protein